MSAGATVTLLYLSALVVATVVTVYVAITPPHVLSVPAGCTSQATTWPPFEGQPARVITVVTCPLDVSGRP